MAYRLKPGSETVEEGVRRIAGEEFARIAEVIAAADLPAPRKVHEVRKCTKRLRSLIRLIGPVFDEASIENAALRDAARNLSEARDSGAILDSLRSLKLPPETLADAEAALAGNTGAPSGAVATSKLLKTFGRDMRSAAKRAAGWDIRAEGFDALQPGLKRSYRKLRRNFSEAIRTGEEEAIHDWRKSAKSHWHHTLLLGRICPDAMDGHARMANRLSESLGDWRDSELLVAALKALPEDRLDKGTLKTLLRATARDQKRLLKKAERISRLLAAEKPAALTARWAAYWEASGT
ncbi:MAG: hypothetical protein C0456_10150 [Hyphomonas sp.]|uniref:CHAD domain-containing protein n=1 Tax=Hyphomonas sp. TaxID=87 RepID=UPI001DE26904|nr:CHAD domain-containing protein [Hyphomonas sp.]MBA4226981.1 hypothetical protein [Hyphomonas sp.]